MKTIDTAVIIQSPYRWTPPKGWAGQPTACLCWSGRTRIHDAGKEDKDLHEHQLILFDEAPPHIQIVDGIALIWVTENIVSSGKPLLLNAWWLDVLERLLSIDRLAPAQLQTTLDYLGFDMPSLRKQSHAPRSLDEEIQHQLREHIDKPLSLNELADQFDRSRSSIIRICKQHLGAAPMRLLAEMRIQKAKDLLQQSEFTVSQIAYQVSYSDLPSFSHFFKKHTGQSPREYRSNCEWLI